MPKKCRADIIKNAVAEFDAVWEPFDQNDFIKGHTFGSGGVCLPLSIVFLGRVACGDHVFKEYVFSEDGQEDVMNLKYRQHTASGYEDSYLKDFGLRLNYDRLNESMGTICELVKHKGYYSIGMTNITIGLDSGPPAGADGHAVVVINDPPICLFFDPNYGLFYFKKMDDLSSFLTRFWRKFYKSLEGLATIKHYSKAIR